MGQGELRGEMQLVAEPLTLWGISSGATEDFQVVLEDMSCCSLLLVYKPLGGALRPRAGRSAKRLLHSGGELEVNISESTNFRGHLHDPSPTSALEMDELEMRLAHYHGGHLRRHQTRPCRWREIVSIPELRKEVCLLIPDLSLQPGSQILQMH